MKIYIAEEKDKTHWDAFIDENLGSFFQYYDWNRIFQPNNWEFIPLIAENNNHDILALFPLYKIKESFCTILKSLPEGSSGGIILKNDLTESKKKAIVQSMIAYLLSHFRNKIDRIIINDNIFSIREQDFLVSEALMQQGFRKKADAGSSFPCTFLLPLKQPFETCIWDDVWDKKIRRVIKSANKRRMTILKDIDFSYEQDFIEMMKQHYIRLHSQPLSSQELLNRLHVFNKKTILYVAIHEKKPIAFLLCYQTKKIVYLSKLAYDYEKRQLQANSLLNYLAIKNACDEGLQYVEFGITFTPNQAEWKKKFKGERIPIHQYQKDLRKIRCLFFDVIQTIRWRLRR